ncbi:MAG TPA: ankyrin repeat domain-containing protein [Leptospiraceae bacterium]|nr:ankyrin repeat domain-containing protein [Leptospiraceae bacterium]
MKIFLLLFLNFLFLSSTYAAEKITKANLLSASASPLLIITSLGCDMGQGYVMAHESNLDDLKGVKIGWADINDIYQNRLFESAGSVEIGDILLVKDGKILDTSKDADAEDSIIAGNIAKKWVYNALKKNKIQFTMKEPEPDFLEPIRDSSPPDITKGLVAHFPLTSDMKNAVDGKVRFTPGSKNKIVNQAYYMDGIYGYTYDQGTISFASDAPEDGYSFSLNVKPEDRKDERQQLLFSGGYRNLDFYRNRKNGQLEVHASSFCKDCGKNKKERWIQATYKFSDVNIELNKWHNFTVSMDFKNSRASVLVNGKRLKDINLGADYTDVYKKRIYYRNQVLALDMAGNGSLLKGYVRDMVAYDRSLSGKELLEVQKKYAVNKINVVETENPVPENKDLPKLNETLLKAAKSGKTDEASAALKEGAEVDTKYKGWTPLLFAAYFGHEETVKELIKNHADPLVEVSGWNAQRFAKAKNYTGIVALLENHSNSSRFFKERKFIVKNSRGDVLPPDLK